MHILIVDDHPMVRAGLRSTLLALDAGATVVEAANLAEARALSGSPVDLVLLDLGLPDSEPIPAVAAIKQAFPETPVAVVSAESDPAIVWAAIDAGASGYLHKTTDAAALIDGLRSILHNDCIHVPRWVSSAPAAPAAAPGSAAGLTPRQIEVVRRVVHGKPNKVIARELGLQEGTVKAHLSAAYRVLNVSNRAQAAVALARLEHFA